MAGSLLIAWLAAAWACEDVEQQLGWATEGLIEADADEARSALDLAESGLGCGAVASPATLARFFLLDGATAALGGDRAATQDAFAAARRIDASVWVDALGARLREQHQAATGSGETGRVDVEAVGWEVRWDGVVATFPADVPAGLHVVQVVGDGEVAFGRVVWLEPGEELVVSSGLPPKQAAAPQDVVEVPARPSGGEPGPVALAFGVGVQGAFGDALSGERAGGEAVTEPGTKLTVPIDVGVVVTAGPLFVRPALGIAPLVGGKFLYATDDGAGASGLALLGELAVGAAAGSVEAGGLVGVAWPGRIAARGLVGLPEVVGPLGPELRLGVDLGTAGRVQPAGSLAMRGRFP